MSGISSGTYMMQKQQVVVKNLLKHEVLDHTMKQASLVANR